VSGGTGSTMFVTRPYHHDDARRAGPLPRHATGRPEFLAEVAMQALRVAFEAARTTVAVAASDDWHWWYGDQLGWLFGPATEQEFRETRVRLLWPAGDPDPHVEQGRWRARYECLLVDHPERREPLLTLVTQARYALIGQYRQAPA
jgi:hypothetical protein